MDHAAEQFDVIVIGSGMGGLTAASLLAQVGRKRVLVLERHFQVGGFTHTFTRKGNLEWDVGLHYVGSLARGSLGRSLFDYITQGQLDWQRMPEVYDRLVFPDFIHDVMAGEAHLKAGYIKRFPHERHAIERYFKDLNRVSRWLQRQYSISLMLTGSLWPLGWMIRKWRAGPALMTTGEYLDRHFRDARCKAVLLGQWPLHGLPPERCSFAIHALLVQHYVDGGYYPVGSPGKIAKSMVPVVEAHGGKVLRNHAVEEILLEGHRVIGVRVVEKKGTRTIEKKFLADKVISDAGAYTTFNRLLPKSVHLPIHEVLESFPNSTGSVTAYLGLKTDPRNLGFHGENYWMYPAYDHSLNHSMRNELVEGKVSNGYLTFPSLKNREARGHTAEITATLDADPFKRWESQPWRHRGAEYEALKKRIGDALIAFVERRFPGFAEQVDYQELSTPITTEYFTGHRSGANYGLAGVPDRFRIRWFSPQTPLRGLFLTGCDAAFFGIFGGMLAGVMSAAFVLGGPWKMRTLVGQALRYSRRLHQEKGMGNGFSSPPFGQPDCNLRNRQTVKSH